MDAIPGHTQASSPPSPTLKIRTMASDLRSLGVMANIGTKLEMKTAISFEPVRSLEEAERKSETAQRKSLESALPRSRSSLIVAGLVAAFLAVAGLVGYFLIYPIIANFGK